MSSQIRFPKTWEKIQYFLDQFDYEENKDFIDYYIRFHHFTQDEKGRLIFSPKDARLRKDTPRLRYIMLRLALKKLVYDAPFSNIHVDIQRLLKRWPRFLGFSQNQMGVTTIPFGKKVDIPQEIFALGTHLHSLSLKRCHLTSLSPQIRSCTNLQSLNLSYNTLSTLPDLSHLPIKHLDIRFNHFEALPSWISRAASLRFGCSTTLTNTLFYTWKKEAKNDPWTHLDDCIAQYEEKREELFQKIHLTGTVSEDFSPTHFDVLAQICSEYYPLKPDTEEHQYKHLHLDSPSFVLPLWVYHELGLLHNIVRISIPPEPDTNLITAPEILSACTHLRHIPNCWNTSLDMKHHDTESSKAKKQIIRKAVAKAKQENTTHLFSINQHPHTEITTTGELFTKVRSGKKIYSKKVIGKERYLLLSQFLTTGKTTHVESLQLDIFYWLKYIHSPMFFSFFPKLKHLTVINYRYAPRSFKLFVNRYMASCWLKNLESLTIPQFDMHLYIPYLRGFSSLKKLQLTGYKEKGEVITLVSKYKDRIPDNVAIYYKYLRTPTQLMEIKPPPSSHIASNKKRLPQHHGSSTLIFDGNPLEDTKIPSSLITNLSYLSLRNCGLTKIPNNIIKKYKNIKMRINFHENLIEDKQNSLITLSESNMNENDDILPEILQEHPPLVKWLRGYQEKKYTVEYYLQK